MTLNINHSLSSSVSGTEIQVIRDPDVQTGKFHDAFALKLIIKNVSFSPLFSDLFLITTGTSL